ncbi:MAG: DUF433 domain-containing protein [Microcoleus sp.]
MTLTSKEKTAIIRTERGLTIAGTRITLYDIMDYLNAGWTPKLIPGWLRTQEQLNAALSYIEEHRSEVEAEYQTVVQTSEEIREYWEAKNRDLFARIAAIPPKPGQEAIRAKIQVHKAKLGITA